MVELRDCERVMETTFYRTPKDDPRDRIEVEIGDSKQKDFYPQLKIMRWDNEVNASFRLLGDTGTHRKDGDVIKYESAKREAHFYSIAPNSEHPEGGYELEVILKEKPATNKVEFSIQSKGLDFFYQPELTQEEKDRGAERPDNVVGSYVAYYKNCPINYVGGKLYRVGKAFHIYRPKIIDADGNWVWGELNIIGNRLTVIIPQKFLDSAVYPIRHAAGETFGYTGLGASVFAPIADASNDTSAHLGEAFNLGENGNITKMSVGMRYNGFSTINVDLFYAAYREDSAGSGSHDLVASAEDLGAAITTTKAFIDINFASELLTADDYVLAAVGNGEDVPGGSGAINVYYDGAAPSRNWYNEQTTGSGSYATRKAEDPWTETSSSGNFQISIYATYTPAGAATAVKDLLGVGIIPFAR